MSTTDPSMVNCVPLNTKFIDNPRQELKLQPDNSLKWINSPSAWPIKCCQGTFVKVGCLPDAWECRIPS